MGDKSSSRCWTRIRRPASARTEVATVIASALGRLRFGADGARQEALQQSRQRRAFCGGHTTGPVAPALDVLTREGRSRTTPRHRDDSANHPYGTPPTGAPSVAIGGERSSVPGSSCGTPVVVRLIGRTTSRRECPKRARVIVGRNLAHNDAAVAGSTRPQTPDTRARGGMRDVLPPLARMRGRAAVIADVPDA
jgi:hypothetical protein